MGSEMKSIESNKNFIKINPMKMFKDDEDFMAGLKTMYEFTQKLKKRGSILETMRKDLDKKGRAELHDALNKLYLLIESVDAEYH